MCNIYIYTYIYNIYIYIFNILKYIFIYCEDSITTHIYIYFKERCVPVSTTYKHCCNFGILFLLPICFPMNF